MPGKAHSTNDTGVGDFRSVEDLVQIMRKKLPKFGHDEKASRDAFNDIDTDRNGTISEEEFRCLFGTWGVDVTEEEAANFYKRVDTNSAGELEYHSLVHHLAVASNSNNPFASANQADTALRKLVKDNYMSLRDAFDDADLDNNGILDLQELRAAVQKAGITLSHKQSARLLEMFDVDKNGHISLMEFMSRIGGGGRRPHSRPRSQAGGFYSKPTSAKPATPNHDVLFGKLLKQVQQKLEKNVTSARHAFKVFDKDRNGKVDDSELGAVLKSWGFELEQDKCKAFMRYIDPNCAGELDYNRFIKHVIERGSSQNTSVFLSNGLAAQADQALKKRVAGRFKSLTAAFRHYDENQDGKIDLEELKRAANSAGVNLSTSETEKLMSMYTESDKLNSAHFLRAFSVAGTQKGQSVSGMLTAGNDSASHGGAVMRGISATEKLSSRQIIAFIREKLHQRTTGGQNRNRLAFKQVDKDGSGQIDAQVVRAELRDVLAKWGLDITAEQLSALMRILDNDGSGLIDYNEFITNIMEEGTADIMRGHNTAEQADIALRKKVRTGFTRVREAFRFFDTDHNGWIDPNELNMALLNAGVRLPKHELQRLFAKYNATDGKITMAKFTTHIGTELKGREGQQGVSNFLTSDGWDGIRRSKKKSFVGFNPALFGQQPETITRRSRYVGQAANDLSATRLLQLAPLDSRPLWTGDVPAGGLHKVVHKVVTQTWKWKALFAAFQHVDTLRTGSLTLPEFAHALQMCGIFASERDVHDVWDSHEKGGRLVYRDFIKHYMITLQLKEKGHATTMASGNRNANNSSSTSNGWTCNTPAAMTSREGSTAARARAHHSAQSARAGKDDRQQGKQQRQRQGQGGFFSGRPQQQNQHPNQKRPSRPHPPARAGGFYSSPQRAVLQKQKRPNNSHGRNNGSSSRRGQGAGRWATSTAIVPQPTERSMFVDPLLKHQVAAKWKSVRRACGYLDPERSGCVPVEALHRVLDSFGIEATIEDMANLPTRIVGGQRLIGYNLFVKACLQK